MREDFGVCDGCDRHLTDDDVCGIEDPYLYDGVFAYRCLYCDWHTPAAPIKEWQDVCDELNAKELSKEDLAANEADDYNQKVKDGWFE